MTSTQTVTSSPTQEGLASPTAQLKLASVGTAAVGLMIALGAHERTDGPLRWLLDLVFWPIGDAKVLADEAQLLAGILGGVMAGFAALIWLMIDALEDRPAALKRIILGAMTIWFVVDSTASVASGGWLNVIGNVGFLALFVLPARRLG